MRPRAYLLTVISLAGALILSAMAVSLVAIRHNLFAWHFSYLFDYQVAKLHGGPPIDILLVGDSSLGNGIDARQWSAEDGIDVVNVALTGAYGYAGSLQMLRRAAENRGVRNAVIVQTPDMMTRPISYEGALFSAVDLGVIAEMPVTELLPWLMSKELLLSLRERLRHQNTEIFDLLAATDYIPQGKPLTAKASWMKPWKPLADDNGKTFYLEKIADYCSKSGIRCFYAHGPIVAGRCSDAGGYYASVNRLIRATGIDLLNDSPPCIPTDKVGDSIDHVVPAERSRFTEIYRALVMERLRQTGGSMSK